MTPDTSRLISETTVGIVEAGRFVGLKRDAAYKAANDGRIPTVRISRKIQVPTAWLRAQLGIDSAPSQRLDLSALDALQARLDPIRAGLEMFSGRPAPAPAGTA